MIRVAICFFIICSSAYGQPFGPAGGSIPNGAAGPSQAGPMPSLGSGNDKLKEAQTQMDKKRAELQDPGRNMSWFGAVQPVAVENLGFYRQSAQEGQSVNEVRKDVKASARVMGPRAMAKTYADSDTIEKDFTDFTNTKAYKKALTFAAANVIGSNKLSEVYNAMQALSGNVYTAIDRLRPVLRNLSPDGRLERELDSCLAERNISSAEAALTCINDWKQGTSGSGKQEFDAGDFKYAIGASSDASTKDPEVKLSDMLFPTQLLGSGSTQFNEIKDIFKEYFGDLTERAEFKDVSGTKDKIEMTRKWNPPTKRFEDRLKEDFKENWKNLHKFLKNICDSKLQPQGEASKRQQKLYYSSGGYKGGNYFEDLGKISMPGLVPSATFLDGLITEMTKDMGSPQEACQAIEASGNAVPEFGGSSGGNSTTGGSSEATSGGGKNLRQSYTDILTRTKLYDRYLAAYQLAERFNDEMRFTDGLAYVFQKATDMPGPEELASKRDALIALQLEQLKQFGMFRVDNTGGQNAGKSGSDQSSPALVSR